MQTPFEPLKHIALQAFGQLVREWTQDMSNVPHTKPDGRTIIITLEDFRAAMAEKNAFDVPQLGQGAHYKMRDGIIEIELLMRQNDRFSVLLPEPDAILRFNAPGPTDLQVPAIYGKDEWGYAQGDIPPDANATYTVTVQENDFSKFLDPHMAGYCCGQCF